VDSRKKKKGRGENESLKLSADCALGKEKKGGGLVIKTLLSVLPGCDTRRRKKHELASATIGQKRKKPRKALLCTNIEKRKLVSTSSVKKREGRKSALDFFSARWGGKGRSTVCLNSGGGLNLREGGGQVVRLP